MRKRITGVATAMAAATALSTVGVSVAGAADVPSRADSVKASSAAVPGAQLWAKRYSGPDTGYDSARSVVVSPSGDRVFVTGASETASGTDYATVAYSAATGAQLWAKRYNGPANKADNVESLAVSPDGSKVFVTGWSETSKPETEHEGFFTDYATVAYSAATGAQLWVKRYNGPAGLNDGASSVAVARDGTKVVVTGSSEWEIGDFSDYATVAYNATTGAQLWAKRYSNGWASSVASPGNGRVYVTGSSDGGYATVAYNAATGAQLWAKRYPGGSASSLAVSPDRTKVFVTGSSGGYATVAYSATTGAQLWAKRYYGPQSSDTARSIAVARDGTKVFVTGSSFAGMTARYDYATVAYSAATGTQLWVKRYNPGNGFDEAYSVAAGNGKVYVTGSSTPTLNTRSDYATIAYGAATGARLWVQRYNGPGNDYDVAYSVAVNPAGSRVFVAGQSFGTATWIDYATIAYSGG